MPPAVALSCRWHSWRASHEPRATVDLDGIAERCASLGLVHAAECRGQLLEEAARDDLTPARFLERVLEREGERKNERWGTSSLKLSGLSQGRRWRASTGSFNPAPTGRSWRCSRPAPTCARGRTCSFWAYAAQLRYRALALISDSERPGPAVQLGTCPARPSLFSMDALYSRG